jgi:UDP-glucose:(heptosyl)LPS alpha-1,3-glucosyltransferase
LNIVQIVKKFGPVGGMEEYAYRLTQELFKLGFRITVLCETNYSNDYRGINVIELGLHSKPHWLSHYRFSNKVNRWLLENPNSDRIIHSHERESSHHITTFHTTPFNLGKPWILKFSSIRNFFYEKLERRELFSPSVQVIVPVSNILGDLIKQKHPNCSSIIKPAIYPAVALQGDSSSRKREIPVDGGTLGFIGKEWKRKGLPKAIRIWRELKKCRPNLKLKVAGVTKEIISHQLNSNDNGIEVVGFVEDKKSFYQSIDMLIHPAKLEAFGMVISEALAMGILVLCSSECGASEVIKEDTGVSLPYNSANSLWTDKASELLESNYLVDYRRDWSIVASDYKKIYSGIFT